MLKLFSDIFLFARNKMTLKFKALEIHNYDVNTTRSTKIDIINQNVAKLSPKIIVTLVYSIQLKYISHRNI